jgi:hypothetical protein
MDKNKCPKIKKAKYFAQKHIVCDHKLFLWSGYQKNNAKFVTIIFSKKRLKGFFCPLFRGRMDDILGCKKLPIFSCKFCDFKSSEKWRYDRHISTGKHKKETKEDILDDAKSCIPYKCKCGKEYKYRQGLWKHNKVCTFTAKIESKTASFELTNDTIIQLLKQNSDFQHLLLEQNKTIIELSKNNSNTINNINSHNKTFNLQLFLNETCKDAMNLTAFIDSLQLQLSDLENVGKLGFVEGISNIIIKNLNALDVTLRPVHCTDKKRETMYIKDQDIWEKEDEQKSTMHKMVKKIANKNIKLISKFQELHPEWKKITSKVSDQFNKIVIEAMGGKGENDYEKEEKIIKKVAKEIYIDKNLE